MCIWFIGPIAQLRLMRQWRLLRRLCSRAKSVTLGYRTLPLTKSRPAWGCGGLMFYSTAVICLISVWQNGSSRMPRSTRSVSWHTVHSPTVCFPVARLTRVRHVYESRFGSTRPLNRLIAFWMLSATNVSIASAAYRTVQSTSSRSTLENSLST